MAVKAQKSVVKKYRCVKLNLSAIGKPDFLLAFI